MSAGLLAELEALAELCDGAVVSTARGRILSEGDQLDCVELGSHGGEWIEVGVGEALIRLRFAGWVERLSWGDEDGDERGGEDEGRELALDFVAAALFGELRVIERRLDARVLRRDLEVCVAGTWRGAARSGALGAAGLWAAATGKLERRLRSNEGRVPRPRPLRDAGPSGLPGFPWSGAGRSPGAGAAEIAIDGELDLHNFSPKEVAPLIREYIEVCRERGIRDLRIVHGKGKGVLRRTVHALLDRHEAVESYRIGSHGEGSWGATIVRLRGSHEPRGERLG